MENSQESFWLKDMIVLGHGAPNKIKKLNNVQGRCASIWSEKTGYCRIYPIPNGYLYDWEIIDVEVRRPNNDGRENTFIIKDHEKDWKQIYLHIKVHKDNKGDRINLLKTQRVKCIELIRKLAKDSFSDVRDNKRSFGIIKPQEIKGYLEKNRENSEQQATLLDLDYLIMDQKDYKWIPHITYSCSTPCLAKHPHKSTIFEWGGYQWMRKNPNNEEQCKKVFDNLQINKDNWENYLLIGNIMKYPKTYVIVKVIRFKI